MKDRLPAVHSGESGKINAGQVNTQGLPCGKYGTAIGFLKTGGFVDWIKGYNPGGQAVPLGPLLGFAPAGNDKVVLGPFEKGLKRVR